MAGLFSSFFKKKEELPPFHLSSLKADMHSHLIPGIDDGAPTMDHSIAMLSKFESLGYKKVITTPHIMSDTFPNNPEIIKAGLGNLKKEVEKTGLKIEIEAAAEYYFDETIMPLIKKKELLSFGNKYVLIEFGFHSEPQFLDQLFFELKTAGYNPVIAHFERYMYYFGKIDVAEKWRQKGINIQLNLNSAIGQYGPGVKKQAEALIDSKQIDFVGTDCHCIEHLVVLEENIDLPYLRKVGQLLLKNTVL